jgi:hypothetical protein
LPVKIIDHTMKTNLYVTDGYSFLRATWRARSNDPNGFNAPNDLNAPQAPLDLEL